MLPNRNLLYNWHFAFPVNQRGEEEYTNTNSNYFYTIDGWLIGSASEYGNLSLEIHDGYVKITNSGSDTAVFRQRFEQLPIGTYTISVITDNGLETGTVYWGGTESSELINTSFGHMAVGIVGGIHCISFFTLAGKSPKFYAVKLELGTHQTLAHKEGDVWVLNAPPPNKTLELAKCQRYQAHIAGTYQASTNANGCLLDVAIPLSVPMRTTPVGKSPTLSYIYHDGNSYEASNFTYDQILYGGVTSLIVRFGCVTPLSIKKTGSINLDIMLDANL